MSDAYTKRTLPFAPRFIRRPEESFLLFNIAIVIVNVSLVVSSVFLAGCGPDAAHWTPGDEDQIRKLVSEISDARTNKDKFSSLFAQDAVPGQDWLKKTKEYSFVVGDVTMESDGAKVLIDLENHFGEVQSTVTWTFARNADGWRIAAAPIE